MSGYDEMPLLVVGETPNQYRIEAIERMRLAGRLRWLKPDERALVSRYAIPEVLLDAQQQWTLAKLWAQQAKTLLHCGANG
jgi:hypothetical protein